MKKNNPIYNNIKKNKILRNKHTQKKQKDEYTENYKILKEIKEY